MNITKNDWLYEIDVTKYQKLPDMRDEPIDGELEFDVLSIHWIGKTACNVDDIISDDELRTLVWENYDEYQFFTDRMCF